MRSKHMRITGRIGRKVCGSIIIDIKMEKETCHVLIQEEQLGLAQPLIRFAVPMRRRWWEFWKLSDSYEFSCKTTEVMNFNEKCKIVLFIKPFGEARWQDGSNGDVIVSIWNSSNGRKGFTVCAYSPLEKEFDPVPISFDVLQEYACMYEE